MLGWSHILHEDYVINVFKITVKSNIVLKILFILFPK